MKKIATLVFLLISTVCANAQLGGLDKDADNDRKHVLFIKPFALLVSGLDGGLEKLLDDKTSLRISAGYYLTEDAFAYGSEATDMEGFKGELQLRFYLSESKGFMSGVYLGPYAYYKQIAVTKTGYSYDGFSSFEEDNRFTASAGNLGFVVGGQFVSTSRLTLDFFLGGGVNVPIDSDDRDEVHIPIVNPYKKGILMRTGFTIGFVL